MRELTWLTVAVSISFSSGCDLPRRTAHEESSAEQLREPGEISDVTQAGRPDTERPPGEPESDRGNATAREVYPEPQPGTASESD